MKWITREYVKVDRGACPWLITKFVDKDAEFVFVAPDKVMDEAKRLGATPYDVKDVELGHHGKECSFEAVLKKYKLTNDAALVLRRLVRSLSARSFSRLAASRTARCSISAASKRLSRRSSSSRISSILSRNAPTPSERRSEVSDGASFGSRPSGEVALGASCGAEGAIS